MNDETLLLKAIEEARKGLREGGLPIGSVLGRPRRQHRGSRAQPAGAKRAILRRMRRRFAFAMRGGGGIGLN